MPATAEAARIASARIVSRIDVMPRTLAPRRPPETTGEPSRSGLGARASGRERAYRHDHARADPGGARGRALLGGRRPRARPPGDDRVPAPAPATTRRSGARPTATRSARSRSCRGPTARRRGPSAAGCRSTTAARRARTSSRPAPSPRRERRTDDRRAAPELRPPADCGPTSSRRRRWRSTCSATSPPTSRSPTGPSTPGGRTRRARSSTSASPTRPAASTPPTSTASGAFDAAFVLDRGDGHAGDRRGRRQLPRAHQGRDPEAREPVAQPRGRRAIGRVRAGRDRRCSRAGRELAVMWLEHLLLLSMLQHESGAWTWGRYVVVHPAGNADVADAVRALPGAPRRRRRPSRR